MTVTPISSFKKQYVAQVLSLQLERMLAPSYFLLFGMEIVRFWVSCLEMLQLHSCSREAVFTPLHPQPHCRRLCSEAIILEQFISQWQASISTHQRAIGRKLHLRLDVGAKRVFSAEGGLQVLFANSTSVKQEFFAPQIIGSRGTRFTRR